MNTTSPPPFGEALAEIVPLIGFIPAYGPPVASVLGPWLLLGLIVAGPLAWFFALVVVLIFAATVVASLVAAPVLLVRHVRRHRTRNATTSVRVAQVVTIEAPRVAT